MKNFTVGPVESPDSVLEIGKQSSPYFRTPEFSSILKENERLFLELVGSPNNSRALFLTGSGTAAMEAAVSNLLNINDKVLIINGGSFGQRFVDLCQIYKIPYTEIHPQKGYSITEQDLEPFNGQNYSALLVNIHETSTGVLYDSRVIRDFVKQNNLLLIVDAVSAFLADSFNMSEIGANVVLTGSQKALACQPGISILALDAKACKIVSNNNVQSMYFDLKNYLSNGERGQTPYTPAVTILLQINRRMKEIKRNGGITSEILKTKLLAEDFRNKLDTLPLEVSAYSLSNAITPVATGDYSATSIVNELKTDYGIWVCPNAGDQKDRGFRVGHLGDLGVEDNTILINALGEILSKYDIKKSKN